MIEPKTFEYNQRQEATIGGVALDDLINTYQTPLFVLDQQTLHDQCRAYLDPLETYYENAKVLYAGKALLTVGIAQLMNRYGMCLDVSSGGELYTAKKAGFPPEKIYFHGNNKSKEELNEAIDYGINIIIDNEEECQRIIEITNEYKKNISVLIRLKPEIDAHTHDYIRTGHLASKFGIEQKDLLPLIQRINQSEYADFKGIHSHIGSQIFDTKAYDELIRILVPLCYRLKSEHGIHIEELNIGGGIGIDYTSQDDAPHISEFIEKMTTLLKQQCKQFELELPTLLFEPGRSIVGPAGISIYKVGAKKEIKDIKTYLFVDGGMGDNPRPITYQAKYAFDKVKKQGRMHEKVTIAGKYCESGDILGEDIAMEACDVDDFIIMFSTGAYGYSMASNYNRQPRPAVILVNEGASQMLVKRETYDDLVRLDMNIGG